MLMVQQQAERLILALHDEIGNPDNRYVSHWTSLENFRFWRYYAVTSLDIPITVWKTGSDEVLVTVQVSGSRAFMIYSFSQEGVHHVDTYEKAHGKDMFIRFLIERQYRELLNDGYILERQTINFFLELSFSNKYYSSFPIIQIKDQSQETQSATIKRWLSRFY